MGDKPRAILRVNGKVIGTANGVEIAPAKPLGDIPELSAEPMPASRHGDTVVFNRACGKAEHAAEALRRYLLGVDPGEGPSTGAVAVADRDGRVLAALPWRAVSADEVRALVREWSARGHPPLLRECNTVPQHLLDDFRREMEKQQEASTGEVKFIPFKPLETDREYQRQINVSHQAIRDAFKIPGWMLEPTGMIPYRRHEGADFARRCAADVENWRNSIGLGTHARQSGKSKLAEVYARFLARSVFAIDPCELGFDARKPKRGVHRRRKVETRRGRKAWW